LHERRFNAAEMTMSELQQPINRSTDPPRRDLGIPAAFANHPSSLWVATLASVSTIIGGVGPWATVLNFMSISGTSMHGWREVGAGAVGLVMLGLHQVRGGRLPLIVAGVAATLGALLAITTLSKIDSGGAVTVLGVQYRYMDAAWGLYLVLVGTVTLLLSTCALAWHSFRTTR
jgi:hypothetical protein